MEEELQLLVGTGVCVYFKNILFIEGEPYSKNLRVFSWAIKQQRYQSKICYELCFTSLVHTKQHLMFEFERPACFHARAVAL